MKKYRILIVDDERPLAQMTCINFPTDRFLVTPCFSGADALEETRKQRPDLIILDIIMPGMDGWEVLLKLKSDPKTSSIPVIMCTAKDGLADVEKSFHYGAQAYAIKPVVFKKLLSKVAAILDIEGLLTE